MGWRSSIAKATLSAAFSVTTIAFAAQQEASKPKLEPWFENQEGTIITGLSGIVTATQQPLATNYLSHYRTKLFRDQFQSWLNGALSVPPGKTGPAFKLWSADDKTTGALKPFDPAKLSYSAVLCELRGPYEVLATQASYISATAAALTTYETVKSSSLVSTIADVFKQNTIKIPETKMTDKDVVVDCGHDLNGDWTASYYPQPSHHLAAGVGLTPLSDLNTLIDIFQGIFGFFDQEKRRRDIVEYLKNNKEKITNNADNLVKAESALASELKNYAIGQFADKMRVVVTQEVDLSKISDCGLPDSASLPATGKDAITNNKFASCYAQAWQLVADPVQTAIVAAANYDTVADVSVAEKKLAKAVDGLNKNFKDLEANNGKFDINALFDDVTTIISYSQQVQKALSPSTK